MAEGAETTWTNFSVLQCMLRRKSSSGPNSSNDQGRTFINSANLTVVAIGTHFGYGVYVVSSLVAQKVTGPAILISFVMASICSFLSGLCHAELSTRTRPFGQSLHSILHQITGEFSAFLASWLTILTHVGVIATCARVFSAILDYISGQRLSGFMSEKIGILPVVDSYPDFLAVVIVVVFCIICAADIGVNRTLSYLLNVTTLVLSVFIMVAMLFFSRGDNWFTEAGLVTHGPKSIFTGASMCFYCFVGFEFVLTRGRDSLKTTQAITGIMALSNFLCLLIFVGISCATLVVAPSANMTSFTPILKVVDSAGATWVLYVIAIATLLALVPVMMHSVASSLDALAAITADGNNCRCCKATVSANSVSAISFLGLISAMLALFVNAVTLIKLTALPCLLMNAFMIMIMLLLRFKPDFNDVMADEHPKSPKESSPSSKDSFNSSKLYKRFENEDDESESEDSLSSDLSETDIDAVVEEYREKIRIASIKNFESPSQTEKERELKRTRARLARWVLVLVMILVAFTCTLAGYGFDLFLDLNVGFIIVIGTSSAIISLCTVLLTVNASYQNTERVMFQVPLVPLLPMVALVTHLLLATALPWPIMAATAVWMTLGVAIYFSCLFFNKCRPVIAPDGNGVQSDEERILLQPLPSYSSNRPQPIGSGRAAPRLCDTTRDPAAGEKGTKKPISYNIKPVQIP